MQKNPKKSGFFEENYPDFGSWKMAKNPDFSGSEKSGGHTLWTPNDEVKKMRAAEGERDWERQKEREGDVSEDVIKVLCEIQKDASCLSGCFTYVNNIQCKYVASLNPCPCVYTQDWRLDK